jgi:hypothetical protein
MRQTAEDYFCAGGQFIHIKRFDIETAASSESRKYVGDIAAFFRQGGKVGKFGLRVMHKDFDNLCACISACPNYCDCKHF